MLEEIEMLKSRTEMILMQLLARWEQGAITAPGQAQSPYGRLAMTLSEVNDKLSEATEAARDLGASLGECTIEFSVDDEERRSPARSRKSSSK